MRCVRVANGVEDPRCGALFYSPRRVPATLTASLELEDVRVIATL